MNENGVICEIDAYINKVFEVPQYDNSLRNKKSAVSLDKKYIKHVEAKCEEYESLCIETDNSENLKRRRELSKEIGNLGLWYMGNKNQSGLRYRFMSFAVDEGKLSVLEYTWCKNNNTIRKQLYKNFAELEKILESENRADKIAQIKELLFELKNILSDKEQYLYLLLHKFDELVNKFNNLLCDLKSLRFVSTGSLASYVKNSNYLYYPAFFKHFSSNTQITFDALIQEMSDTVIKINSTLLNPENPNYNIFFTAR